MQRLFRKVIAVIEWWSVLLLVLMVTLVCVGVFFRYVLNASLAWYDEFASYLLVWLTFYGVVVATYRGRHIGFEVIVEKLDPMVRRLVDLLSECFVLAFQFVLLYYGWELMQKMGDDRAVSLPWVKMSWIYSVLPITGGLMLIITAMRLFDIAFARERKTEGEVAWSGSSSE
ncbi:MAG TPA: TRAP transporter small permease [Candidatus Binatia bacterium]|jgi:TRAP-type C4-dicarboxylate transport system permease small subunit